MTLPLHLVEDLGGVAVGDSVEVTGSEGHHAVAVRRLRVGERIAVTDGRGTRVVGTVDATGKRSLTLRAEEIVSEPRPTPEVVVVQAVPKGDRGELAVEVLTEVGVDVVVPWSATRCVAAWRGERGDKALGRWRSTAREAAKQARRAWHPEVRPLADTGHVAAMVAALVSGGGLAVVLHEEAVTALADLDPSAAGRILVVVGPEGGLVDEEVDALTRAGATGVRLGPEVLRTSTAGVAAVGALLSQTPRWR